MAQTQLSLLQAMGTARLATPAEDERAREALQRAAPECGRHFANPDCPVVLVHVSEITFVDRNAGIVPRQHLILDGEEWRFI